MSDPLRRPEPTGDLTSSLSEWGDRLVDLFFERAPSAIEPAPSAAPLTAASPALAAPAPRAVRLARGRRVACVSLVAGCGTTTLAALLAQRSGGAGGRGRLVDLDLVAPTLALLAGQRTPTVTDVLADPGLSGRRWGSVEAIYGAASELGQESADALATLVRRLASDAAVVVDAGVLVAPGCARVLAACDTVLYVTTPRAAHLHAASRAVALLADLGLAARLAVTRADDAGAARIAAELGVPLAGAVPEDPFLARDEFRIRAETAAAVDRLCAALGS